MADAYVTAMRDAGVTLARESRDSDAADQKAKTKTKIKAKDTA